MGCIHSWGRDNSRKQVVDNWSNHSIKVLTAGRGPLRHLVLQHWRIALTMVHNVHQRIATSLSKPLCQHLIKGSRHQTTQRNIYTYMIYFLEWFGNIFTYITFYIIHTSHEYILHMKHTLATTHVSLIWTEFSHNKQMLLAFCNGHERFWNRSQLSLIHICRRPQVERLLNPAHSMRGRKCLTHLDTPVRHGDVCARSLRLICTRAEQQPVDFGHHNHWRLSSSNIYNNTHRHGYWDMTFVCCEFMLLHCWLIRSDTLIHDFRVLLGPLLWKEVYCNLQGLIALQSRTQYCMMFCRGLTTLCDASYSSTSGSRCSTPSARREIHETIHTSYWRLELPGNSNTRHKTSNTHWRSLWSSQTRRFDGLLCLQDCFLCKCLTCSCNRSITWHKDCCSGHKGKRSHG